MAQLGRTHLNLYTIAKWYPREILFDTTSKLKVGIPRLDSREMIVVDDIKSRCQQAVTGSEFYSSLWHLTSFRFYSLPQENHQLWCYAQIRQPSAGNDQGLSADIYLSDEIGRVIAEVIGFETRKPYSKVSVPL